MKRTTPMILLSLILPISELALAADGDIDYSWLRLQYVSAEVDVLGVDLDAEGLAIDLSVPFHDNVYMFASYDSLELEDVDEVTANQLTMGLGTNFDLTDRVGLFSQVGYISLQGDVGRWSDEDDGLRITAGVRARVARSFELRAAVDHVELDELGGDTGGILGADLFLTEHVAFTAELNRRDDISGVFMGVRIFFGNVDF